MPGNPVRAMAQPGPAVNVAHHSSGFLIALLARAATTMPVEELARRALVFSPHPDDECLACGGTILKKTQAGAIVTLVHMTDGSGSHPHLMSRRELSAIRRREALNAATALGIHETYFLDYQDSGLAECIKPATKRVVEILRKEQPEEVFVPYFREPWRQAADHIAATNIVLSAIDSYPGDLTVWEYPVWFWLHWPWVRLLQRGCAPIKTRHVALNSLRNLFGLRAFLELKYSLDISDVLKQKAAALAEHRSQMTRFIPDPAWTTLEQVSSGQFLSRFYVDHEFFRRSVRKKSHA